MRRNFKAFLKYLVLVLATVTLTSFLFRIVNPRQAYDAPPISESLHYVKIDWHNYDVMKLDEARTGLGERGVPAFLTDVPKEEVDRLYSENGFNGALSDRISVDRAIKDIRNPGCLKRKYLQDLPTVSVIVPFHNEHWSTLMRTVHSVVNRSPKHLLKEIILVDDFSNKKKTAEVFSAEIPKVRVIHLPKRQGLINARSVGARAATGDVFVFLDSHVEANINWLPPLLEPIKLDYRTCVCPFIDVIDFDNFEYRAQDEGARGAFDWEFFYKRLPLLPEDKLDPTEPFKSPVMAGGLFAISAKFFWELGGYDDGLDIWGGEQYELSFKIWQCGGKMYDAPCSRVGHIYRKFAPFPNARTYDFVGRNYRRVAEVWMDEYAEYLYMRRPHYRAIDPGDLTKQRAIRTNLNCKPFKWFMETVAFDLPKKYPYVEPPDYAYGSIQSVAASELCVDTANANKELPLILYSCTGNDNQNFSFTWHKDIRPKGRKICWDVPGGGEKPQVNLYDCHSSHGNQYWTYDPNHQWLVHGESTLRCLDCDPGAKKLYVTKCDEKSPTQKWRFSTIDLKLLSERWYKNEDEII